MSLKLTYYGKVTDDIHIYRAKEMREMIIRNFAGMSIQLTIEKKKKARSLSQNNYLHMMLTILTEGINSFGNKYQMEEIKEMIKFKFLKVDVYNEDTGEKIGERIKHTSELTTVEFNVFIEDIIRYAVEMFNIQLPYPNEQLNINL